MDNELLDRALTMLISAARHLADAQRGLLRLELRWARRPLCVNQLRAMNYRNN